MPASRFLKYTGRNWPNPVCSSYLPVSTSRDDPVRSPPNQGGVLFLQFCSTCGSRKQLWKMWRFARGCLPLPRRYPVKLQVERHMDMCRQTHGHVSSDTWTYVVRMQGTWTFVVCMHTWTFVVGMRGTWTYVIRMPVYDSFIFMDICRAYATYAVLAVVVHIDRLGYAQRLYLYLSISPVVVHIDRLGALRKRAKSSHNLSPPIHMTKMLTNRKTKIDKWSEGYIGHTSKGSTQMEQGSTQMEHGSTQMEHYQLYTPVEHCQLHATTLCGLVRGWRSQRLPYHTSGTQQQQRALPDSSGHVSSGHVLSAIHAARYMQPQSSGHHSIERHTCSWIHAAG